MIILGVLVVLGSVIRDEEKQRVSRLQTTLRILKPGGQRLPRCWQDSMRRKLGVPVLFWRAQPGQCARALDQPKMFPALVAASNGQVGLRVRAVTAKHGNVLLGHASHVEKLGKVHQVQQMGTIILFLVATPVEQDGMNPFAIERATSNKGTPGNGRLHPRISAAREENAPHEQKGQVFEPHPKPTTQLLQRHSRHASRRHRVCTTTATG
ncbi:hypothetical protein HRbin30_01565 [bacterium HR30]|nr:hypothetical protein HRbin30_01565 [bacterium HR30]